METKKVVVDFGSGSGNLCLVLASFYKHSTFVFVDQNEKSLGKKIFIIFIKSQNSKDYFPQIFLRSEQRRLN